MKRGFDIIISLVLLALVLPFFPLLAVLIVASDRGPVFFRQKRMGRHGKPFSLIKFRSMRQSREEAGFRPGDRSRIFPVGRMLRASKMDELPQLWNVLKGDMSLVGPRPEVEKWTLVYPERWERVLQVRPGITDEASIAYRHEEELLASSEDPERTYREEILPGKLDLYEAYTRKHSLAGDVRILGRTLVSIFK